MGVNLLIDLLKKKQNIIFIAVVMLFPIIANLFLFSWGTNITNGKLDTWILFFASYYGAIGGGLFTFLGVSMTLNNPVEKRKQRKLLLLQLKLIHKDINMFAKADGKNKYPISQFLVDQKWLDRLGTIHNDISEEDFQNIYMWYVSLDYLKSHQDENGLVSGRIINNLFREVLDDMPLIIERLKKKII